MHLCVECGVNPVSTQGAECSDCQDASEIDRLRAELAAAVPVVEAARALLEHGWPLLIDTSVAKGRELEGLLDQLAARVRAHTDTTGGRDE